MSESARALLDELMGRHRNAPLNSTVDVPSWRDPEICKYYICGWCPVRHFEGTKCDIGSCREQHNEVAKMQFQETKWSKKRRTYQAYMDMLFKLQEKLVKRTKFANYKLREVAQENDSSARKSSYTQADTIGLNRQLEEMEYRIERLGEEGKVEEAKRLMNQVDILKNAKEHLRPTKISRDGLSKLFANSAVCEVCGGVQNQDPDKLKMHNAGKIHTGFLMLPEKIREVEELFERHGNNSKDDSDSSSDERERRIRKSTRKERRRRRRRSRSRSSGYRRR